MRNLLSANFTRLWKNRFFWICVLAVLVISVISILNGGRQALLMKQEGYIRTLDDYYFYLLPFIGLLFAVFDSLFLGTEYSDGTIRNKIVVGHIRSSVFLSNLMVCLAANLLLLLAGMVGGLVGIPFLGFWKMGAAGLAWYITITVCCTAALTAIMTLICMLSTNKAITVVTTIIIAFGLLIIASILYNALCENEFFGGIVITAEGMKQGDSIPNPNYVSGLRRTIYQFIIDFLPTGQQIQIASVKIGHPILSLLSSVIITVVTTIAGIVAFSRKDLK